MGYPIAYRNGLGPQIGRAPALLPPRFPGWAGPFAGAAAMAWALNELKNNLQNPTAPLYGGRPYPGAYGWTLAIDCGRPPLREIRSAGVTGCGGPVTMSETTFNSGVHGPTATNIHLWDTTTSYFEIVVGQRRMSGSYPAQRWDRGLAGPIPGVIWGPKPGYLLGGPLPFPYWAQALAGVGARGYSPPLPDEAARPAPWGRPVRWGDVYVRDIYDPSNPAQPSHPAQPVVVPRAVPLPLTKETKVGTNTAAGRAFLSLLQTFNFMGDVWGFVGALWRALPRDARGTSRRLDRMLADLFRNWDRVANADFLLAAALNVSLWKFSDTVMGSTSQSIFNAQMQTYGANLARTWSMLDSATRAGVQSMQRQLAAGERRQGG